VSSNPTLGTNRSSLEILIEFESPVAPFSSGLKSTNAEDGETEADD